MDDCRECLYFKICKQYADDVRGDYDDSHLFDDCDDFQNKSDFVKVVRCKDCEYRYTHICAITGTRSLFCDYGIKPVPVEDAHYCGYGERKGKNDE